ncbi:hypothetical protein [Peribacillus sp. R9-11]|nr:hypothetical protein [Peribacillus sp. R9-11]WMX54163.1 hypothetical protein RE409_19060 [Peribacillus sp. R9-11]
MEKLQNERNMALSQSLDKGQLPSLESLFCGRKEKLTQKARLPTIF